MRDIEILENDNLRFIFENDKGEEISSYISFSDVIKSLEDLAYEKITIPNCNSSSCSVNNFC